MREREGGGERDRGCRREREKGKEEIHRERGGWERERVGGVETHRETERDRETERERGSVGDRLWWWWWCCR